MRGQQALKNLINTPVMVYEPYLQTMIDVLDRAIETRDVDLEAVAAKVGKRLDYTRTVDVRDGVAIIPIEGSIFRHANLFTEWSGGTTVETLAQDLDTALNSPEIKAILLYVDSPGGEVNGINELASMIYQARSVKPITAYAAHYCCSAALWLASSASEVVVDDTAVVGSIGVVAAYRNEKDAKRVEFVSSKSPNKRPDLDTDKGRQQIQQMIDATAEVFIEAMARNRGVSTEKVERDFGQGGVMVGRDAVAAGLADRLGSFEQVLMELATGGTQEYHKGDRMFGRKDDGAPVATVNVNVMDAPEVRQALDEAAEQITAMAAERDEANTQRDEALSALESERVVRKNVQEDLLAATEALGTAQARIAALEAEARQARFAALIDGGKARPTWSGSAEAHLTVLATLADAHGEDSEAFRGYVDSQNAVAAQLATSDLFKPIGSDAGGDASLSALARLEAIARETMKTETGLTFAQAFDRALEAHKDLYAAYQAERQTSNKRGN